MALEVTWGKCPAYLVDEWCRLLETDLGHMRFNTEGVYVIWQGSQPPTAVKVGHGRIKDRLAAERTDPRVLEYEMHGLYATWARVPSAQREGVVRYLAEALKPVIGSELADVQPVEVNLPEW